MARTNTRTLLAVLATSVLILVGCGSDDDNGSSNGNNNNGQATGIRDTSVEPPDDISEYCDKTEELINSGVPPVESAEAQLEVAPDDLKDDIQLMLDWVSVRDDDSVDPEVAAAAEDAGYPATQRVFATLKAECGITVPLG